MGDVERFLYREAALLDDGRFEEWVDLFTDDAVYWLPIDTTRREPRGGLNLIYDDRARLGDRLSLLRSGFSHTEEPPSRTSHLVGSVRVVDGDERGALVGWVALADGDVAVTSRQLIARLRREETDTFHARATFVLRPEGASYRIRVKRLDLLGADLPLPALTFLL